jgi:hypothetical protein
MFLISSVKAQPYPQQRQRPARVVELWLLQAYSENACFRARSRVRKSSSEIMEGLFSVFELSRGVCFLFFR